jgi:hypothetical protein
MTVSCTITGSENSLVLVLLGTLLFLLSH